MEIIIEDLNKTRVIGAYNCMYLLKKYILGLLLIIFVTSHSWLDCELFESKAAGQQGIQPTFQNRISYQC